MHGGQHSENGGGSGQCEATGQRQVMLTVTTMPIISEMRTTQIRQRWHQPWQSACAGIIITLARMAFSVQSLWTDPTTTTPSGHGANGRGGIASWGRGARTTMKVKNNDDDEDNATTTITLTLETTMTICVVDYGNCPIVDCRPYC
jgi:hypothetical protein